MDHISTLLSKVLHKRGIKHEADASLVVHTANLWIQETMGALENEIRATKYVKPVLVISIHSSVAAQECQGRSDELLSHLQERFPELPIERIRILREMAPSR